MGANPVGAKLYEYLAPPERLTLMLEALARDDEAEATRLRDTCPRKMYTQQEAGFADRRDVAFEVMLTACIDLRAMCARLHMLQWAIAVGRRLATWQQINATMAFLDGERYGRRQPQLDFFDPREDEGPADAEDAEDETEPAGADEADEADEEPSARGLRMSRWREGELARRMSAVEDRAERHTDAALLPLVAAAGGVAQDLVNIWAAYGRFCRSRLGVSPEVMLRAWEVPLLAELEELLAECRGVGPQAGKVAEYADYCFHAWDRRFGTPEDDHAG
jgi:hypothetical protein